MAKQRYIVMPEIEWVNGAPVPLDRVVLLTPEEARYDLAQGRIYLDGTQPPVTPPAPVLAGSDVITLSRGGLSHRVTMAELVAFLDGQPGGPTLALSTLVFKAGVSAGAILAAITMPAGWQAAAETTFGGRATVSGTNLVAAIDIAPATAVTGSIRLKATSPDTLTSITQTFAVAFEAVTAPPVPDVTAPVITSAIAFSQAENAALLITLTANEAVTWAKIGGSDAAAFTLDAAAGTLTLAARDFDAPADSDGNNTYAVQIRATDAAGNASTQTITVTITNLFDTARTPLTAGSVTMAYNAANGARVLDLPPLVEGEARSISVSWLTPDSTSGDVFRNAMTGPAQSTIEQQIPVDVTTTQGGLNPVTTRFTIVVPAVTAADTTPPTITSAIAFSQAENAALVITLTANEAVTWAKIGGTDAAAFTLDAAAGTLTLAGKDFDVPSDSDGNNTFAVQIRATDAAGNASTQTITVTITNLFDTPRQPLTASSVTMAYNAANGTKVLDLPPLVEGEARAVSVSWLTPDSLSGDVFRNAMAGPSQSASEQQIPVDVTTTVGGANPVVTRFTVVVPAVGGVTKLPPNARFAVMGDSIFAGSDTRNLTEVIATVSKSRLQAGIGSRLAQGGRTMQDMLNEILLGGGTQMGAATAQKLDLLIFNGGTNDLAPGSGGTPRTLDEMKADHQSIVDLAKASGVKVVARSTIPRTKTVDDSTSKRQMFNAWLRSRTDIVLGDVENTFDPNDLVFANPDGIHATINGVIHSYAAVLVAALEPYFDTSFDATAADPANLDADCRITGTGGTIGAGIASDSTVANGWTVANASTATVRVDTIDGRMRVTASGNASAVASITLQNSIPISGNFTPGKNIRATQKARIARASQDAGPIGVRLLTGALGTFGGFLSTTYETATGPLTTILDGVMQMIPKRWSGGGSPSVLETITVSVAAGAVDFVLDIGPGNALFSEPVAYCPPDLVPGRAVPIVVSSASSGNTTNAVEFGAWYGGGYTFTFQHFKNGVAISGATGRTYVQPTSGAAGDYFCEVTCTNALGAKTFRTAAITVP